MHCFPIPIYYPDKHSAPLETPRGAIANKV